MAFHPDAATCRRIPLNFLNEFRAQPARRDEATPADAGADESPRAEDAPSIPSHWVDLLHGDTSLDDLFR